MLKVPGVRRQQRPHPTDQLRPAAGPLAKARVCRRERRLGAAWRQRRRRATDGGVADWGSQARVQCCIVPRLHRLQSERDRRE